MRCLFKTYSLTGILYSLTLIVSWSCSQPTTGDTPDYGNDGSTILISTRAGEDTESAIRTLRLFVFAESDGRMLINKSYQTSNALPGIPANTYTYFVRNGEQYDISEILPKVAIKVILVANEPTSLDGPFTIDNLRGKILNFYSMYGSGGQMDIKIDGSSSTSNKGYIPMYAESAFLIHHDWSAFNGKTVNMSLIRTLSKITLQVSKGTLAGGDFEPGDKLKINSASVKFVPEFDYLGDSSFPYENDGVSLATQTFGQPIEIEASGGALTTDRLTFYMPEHIISDASFKNKKYTYIQINATFHSGDTGEDINSVYKIPIGNGVHKLYTGSTAGDISILSKEDLTVSRNTTYNVDAEVSTHGKLEIFQVKVGIVPWEGEEEMDGSVDTPLLNVTNTMVRMSQKVVRVHFWSNQPALYVEAEGEKDGNAIHVNDEFVDLSGISGQSTTHFKLYADTDNDHLPYNGYIDIELKNSADYDTEHAYLLTLKAGDIKRTIRISTNPVMGEIIFDANGGTGTFTREVRYKDLEGKELTEVSISVENPEAGITPPTGKRFLAWVYSSDETPVTIDKNKIIIQLRGYSTAIKALWQ